MQRPAAHHLTPAYSCQLQSAACSVEALLALFSSLSYSSFTAEILLQLPGGG